MSSKTRLPFLRQNQHFFRQINAFTKEVSKELISRKFLSVIAFYSIFPHFEFQLLIPPNFHVIWIIFQAKTWTSTTKRELWSFAKRISVIVWTTNVRVVIFHVRNAVQTNADMNADKTENGCLIVWNSMAFQELWKKTLTPKNIKKYFKTKRNNKLSQFVQF